MYFDFINRKVDRESAIQRCGYAKKTYWRGTSFVQPLEDDTIDAILSEHAQERFKERMLVEVDECVQFIHKILSNRVQSAILDNIRIGVPFVVNNEGEILVLFWTNKLIVLTCYYKPNGNPFFTADPTLWIRAGRVEFYPNGIAVQKL